VDGCGGVGGGVIRSPLIKSIEKQIQFFGSFRTIPCCLATRLFVASDFPHAAPHVFVTISCMAVLRFWSES